MNDSARLHSNRPTGKPEHLTVNTPLERHPDFSKVRALMHRALKDHVFPGAVLLVQTGRRVLYHGAFGVTDLQTRTPVTPDTLFDLASLTKPLATALAVMLLVQDGKLELNRSLGSIIPPSEGTEKAGITIAHLLLHTSGLPAHRPYYRQITSPPVEDPRKQLNRFLIEEPLIGNIGGRMLYSDIGFMFLRWVVETVSGMTLDRFAAEKIYEPLGISPLFFIDSSKDYTKRRFAATQWCPWRNSLLQGVVSDENAGAVGGVDGHAGLFGTAKSVGDLLGELMAVHSGEPNREIFQPEWTSRFFRRDDGSGRSLGFDMPTPGHSSSGRYFSLNTIGHLGYTGTSFWSDLDSTVSIILLTNRVHPSIKNDSIRTFRPLIHNAVMRCLVATGD